MAMSASSPPVAKEPAIDSTTEAFQRDTGVDDLTGNLFDADAPQQDATDAFVHAHGDDDDEVEP